MYVSSVIDAIRRWYNLELIKPYPYRVPRRGNTYNVDGHFGHAVRSLEFRKSPTILRISSTKGNI